MTNTQYEKKQKNVYIIKNNFWPVEIWKKQKDTNNQKQTKIY